MNSHEKTTLGVLLKGSNQGAMHGTVILMLGGISFPEFWACVGFFHESHKKYKYVEHVEHLLKVVGSRVVPTNEASYGGKGFLDTSVLVAKKSIWVVSEELEYSEM
eukprot:7387041-Prymnesium_polylepis.1